MTMNVLNAVAQFERDLLIERTESGFKRAKAEGKFSAAHQSERKAETRCACRACGWAERFSRRQEVCDKPPNHYACQRRWITFGLGVGLTARLPNGQNLSADTEPETGFQATNFSVVIFAQLIDRISPLLSLIGWEGADLREFNRKRP
jgi:hypothetical protein